jgi:hypothetical protein
MILIPISSAFLLMVVIFVVAVVTLIQKYRRHVRYKRACREWWGRNPNPELHCDAPPPVPPPKSVWSVAATVLASIAAAGGLAVLAMVVLLFVTLATGGFKWGNK